MGLGVGQLGIWVFFRLDKGGLEEMVLMMILMRIVGWVWLELELEVEDDDGVGDEDEAGC